jgi:hypothetical protein
LRGRTTLKIVQVQPQVTAVWVCGRNNCSNKEPEACRARDWEVAGTRQDPNTKTAKPAMHIQEPATPRTTQTALRLRMLIWRDRRFRRYI